MNPAPAAPARSVAIGGTMGPVVWDSCGLKSIAEPPSVNRKMAAGWIDKTGGLRQRGAAMDPRARNWLELNLAVLLWGGTALFAKLIHLPVSQIICGRSVVSALALGIYLRWTGASVRIGPGRDRAMAVAMGLCLALHWLTYFHAIRVATVAVAIVALHTYPVVTSLVEPWFFGERFRRTDLAVALAVFAGIGLMVPELSLSSETTRGIAWGILSGLFFAARNLLNRHQIRRWPGSVMMLHQSIVTAVATLPLAWAAGADQWDGLAVRQLVLLGVVFTALPQALFNNSFAHLTARTVSVIATLLPIYGAVFAALILGEIPAIRTVAGGSVVLGAVLFETIRQWDGARRKRLHDPQP